MAQLPIINSDLSQILFVPADQHRTVARRGVELISYHELITRVAAVKAAVERKHNNCWLIFFDDTLEFAIALLALLSAQKQIVVAPNKQSGTLLSLAQNCDAVLSDQVLPVDDVNFQSMAFQINSLSSEHVGSNGIDPSKIVINASATISIATSGSSGDIQLFEKPLATFLAEMDCLESQWQDVVKDAIFFSTVSHQHIYGLLFRLLWPLRTGRVFCADTYSYPEPLFNDMRSVDKAVLISSPAHLKRIPEAINDADVQQPLAAVFSSGGPLTHGDALEFFSRFGKTPIEVFGSTETGGVAFRQQTSSDENSPWSVFPDVSVSVNADGCLLVRSPFVFTPGEFLMGDKVTKIDDKHFLHHGRADRIVKLEEKRLSLTAMENQLNAHSLVAESRIILLEEGKRQQLGAVVVLKDGTMIVDTDNKRMLNEQLKNHLLLFFERSLLPRKWRYINSLPVNSQGKVTVSELTGLFSGNNSHE